MQSFRYYVQADAAGRIIGAWSTGVSPNRDAAGAVLLGHGTGTQFRLEPGGMENPPLRNKDGTHRYIYDPGLAPAYREATAEELAAERAEIEAVREPPGPTMEEKQLDMLQEIVEMRAQLAQLQINGGM